eukprot:CAMPEP_0177716566 /NCGR_PEP_ID=MMETSP0484_2-20121128/14575_1 /TAXON_ID=354590 /ORGANISM="Rhodomonas lens, Strain RHODO" /LENGTH=469 /DNA_ID=CAMNT_0019228599 /DNA_START=78 /DNA_END=1487 /DNA_ORIENTATION=+
MARRMRLALSAMLVGAATGFLVGPAAAPLPSITAAAPRNAARRSCLTMTMTTDEQSPPSLPANVVLCGGGIQSAAIAYYLSERGVSSTVIEQCEVACAASGKAGGFLARNWGAGATSQLHQVSFKLHQELAEDLSLQGYRKLPTLAVTPGSRSPDLGSLADKGQIPAWLDGDVEKASLLDDPGLVRRSMNNWDTAQTDPRELTEKLLAAAAAKAGSRVVTGTVQGVVRESCSENGGERGERVTGLIVDGEEVAADVCVFAMGPWTCLIEDWFEDLTLPMQGICSTSVVYRAAAAVDAFALFCGEDELGCNLEVYPRAASAEHEVYVCGVGGSRYLNNAQLKQVRPDGIEADAVRAEAGQQAFAALSSLGLAAPQTTQACLRPCPPDALPYLGAVPGTCNAYAAAGHNCWGILWAPVTGKAMAELILEGTSNCVDLAPFDPARFSGGEESASARTGRGRQRAGEPVGEQW